MEDLKIGDEGRHEYDLTPEAHLEIKEILDDGKLKVVILNPQSGCDDDGYFKVNRKGFIKY
jgi:hypothetical protein